MYTFAALAAWSTMILFLNSHASEPWGVSLGYSALWLIGCVEIIFAGKRISRRVAERERMAELLHHAKDAAEAASRAKSEFLANMSHEIRTPLTAILGYADVMLDYPDTPESRDAAATIKRNGEHLLQVISDILDLSKIEADRLEPECCLCSPRQVVEEIASLMKVRVDAKQLRLAVEYEGTIPKQIRTDPLRLRQILINLIGNAIKFTNAGSVRIVTRLLQEAGCEAKLRFDVIDTGIGVDASQIDLLFQPFMQVDGSARRRFGGSGLGLTVSKRLVGLLGGEITASSVPGQGSTFSVTVATGPIEEAADPSPAASSPSARLGPANGLLACRLLLAEDGPDNQRLISLVLRKAGADVAVAENGQVAVECALAAQREGRPFAAILMDIQMPVMDGHQATARLRQAGFTGLIIALTAHAMPEDRQHCLNAGCDGYLTKPIAPKTLVKYIAERLESPSCAVCS